MPVLKVKKDGVWLEQVPVYLMQKADLAVIADAIRAKTGGTEPLTVEQMVAAIGSMTVQDETMS